METNEEYKPLTANASVFGYCNTNIDHNSLTGFTNHLPK